MYCGKCGNHVNDDASFCPICGNSLAKKNLKVEEKSGKVNLKKQHTNSRKFVAVIIICLVIVLVGGITAFVYLKVQKGEAISSVVSKVKDAPSDTLELKESDIVKIYGGMDYSGALDKDGTLWMWGGQE